jgi:hypothetical protein
MTNVTPQDLRIREPELARLKPNDNELTNLIAKGFNDFALQYHQETGLSITSSSPYFDICVEFLSLSYLFESLIKTHDIYLVKANRYKELSNQKFDRLTPSASKDGSCEIIGILK